MATMNIIQAMNRLRSDIQTWVANNLRVKVNTELKTGSTEEYKVLSDNNFTDADKDKLDSAITGVTPGLGLAGGVSNGVATLNIGAGIGIAVGVDTVAVNIKDSTQNSKASVKGGKSDQLYAVELDKDGNLAVSVPWTATTIEGNEELEELLSEYKTRQPVKSSPVTTDETSTEFIDTISQDANGVITATKKKLPAYTNVTEDTVSGWGFTKNTGTVTSVKINGSTKTPTNGVVDLGMISGGTSITVDSTVSTTSINPVQNKIVTTYIDTEVESAKEYAEEVANTAESEAKSYAEEVANSAKSEANAYTDEKLASFEGGSSVLVINSDVDFKPANDTGGSGTLTNPGVTFAEVKTAIENKQPIILVEPRGYTNYCVRTDYGDTVLTLHFLNNYDNLFSKPFQYTIALVITTTDDGESFVYTAKKTQLQEKLTSGTNIKTINGASLLGSGDITVTGSGEGITVDAELSSTSTNPVQNKIVKAAIADAITTAKDYTDELVGDIKALLIEINGEEV